MNHALEGTFNLLTMRLLQRLSTLVIPPFQQFMRETPAAAKDAPFEYVCWLMMGMIGDLMRSLYRVQLKAMDVAYGIRAVLRDKIPHLKHGNDGLIFTCLNSGYVYGTDPKM